MREISRLEWLEYKKKDASSVVAIPFKIGGAWRGYRYFLKDSLL